MQKRSFLKACFFLFFSLFFSLSLAEESKAYFSSQEDVGSKFIDHLKKEKQQIILVSHRISDIRVIKALLDSHKNGVSVEILVDSASLTASSPLMLLANEGIPVWVWQRPRQKQKTQPMYHIFCVFGEETCWVGSYSFSSKRFSRALANAIVFSNKDVAKKHIEEFETLKKNAVSFLSHIERKKV